MLFLFLHSYGIISQFPLSCHVSAKGLFYFQLYDLVSVLPNTGMRDKEPQGLEYPNVILVTWFAL